MNKARAEAIVYALKEFIQAVAVDVTQRPEDSDVGNSLRVDRTQDELVKVLTEDD